MSLKQDPNQKTVNKEVKKKKKSINRTKDWSFYAIIISLIILAIPTTYIGYHIISAKLATGSVLTGSRLRLQHCELILKFLNRLRKIVIQHLQILHMNVSLKLHLLILTLLQMIYIKCMI